MTFPRSAALCIALLIGSTGMLVAQTAPRPAAPPAAAPAPEALPSTKFPDPSPSHFALAREAALLTGLTRTFDALMPQFAEQAMTSVRSRPEIMKDLAEVLMALEPEMNLQKQRIINTSAKLMAGRISEADLKDVLVFFKSPIGQRWMTAQPLIFDDMVKEAESWTAEVSEYMNIRIRADMAKRGIVLDGR